MSDFTRSRAEGCLSDLRIDRLVRGELAAEAAAESQKHATGCEACRARIAEIEAARASHQAAPPLLKRPAPRRRWATWGRLAATGALAAAAALIAILRPADDGTRTKGGPGASFYIQHAGKLRQVRSGEMVAPGDSLQVLYSSPRPFHGAILSIDGAHHASRYFPEGTRAAPMSAGSGIYFPTSTVLDDVLGQETVSVLFCQEPIALEPVETALAAPGCQIERIELEKR